MSIKLTTARRAAQENGLKILVHGPAGIGKTKLAETIDEPVVIISCEGGMLSLKDTDIPVIEITEFKDLQAAYDLVTGPEGAQFKWVCLDSFTEIAEVCLAAEKKKAPDPRQAYGETQDRVFVMLRKFRDIPGKNVYFICKQTLIKDDSTGGAVHAPMMPGNSLKEGISYHFDEVFALRLFDTGKGDGTTVRMLQTGRDLQYDCKDRSGSLAMYEPADLSAIRKKILAEAPKAQA